MVNLILCGGSGTRLWPLSRKKTPKQFVRLFAGRSLFEENILRNQPLCDTFRVATNIDHLPLVREQLKGLGIQKAEGLIEPAGRNTAPAVALVLMGLPRDELVLVTPSDHRISNLAEYSRAVRRAGELATQDYLVTFGIRPQYAETGYGYIEGDGEDVLSFREKPDKATADSYIASGRHYWNSGMFVFKAGTFLDELALYSPEVFAATTHAYRMAEKGAIIRPALVDMEAIPSISIDYAVMEKSRRVKVVPCNPEWSDLGSFDALYDEGLTGGPETNAVYSNEAMLIDSHRCLIVGGGKPIVLDGVDDLIVVDTEEALLVMRRSQSQNVREVFKVVSETRPDLT